MDSIKETVKSIGDTVMDDKSMVIVCATVIAIIGMFVLSDPQTVVSNVVTGLFGVAVGKSL